MAFRRAHAVLLVVLTALLLPTLAFSQAQTQPKVELFGGYSWYHPGGNVPVIEGQAGQVTSISNLEKGAAGQFAYNLNHWAGLALDGGAHYGDFGHTATFAVGPQFKYRMQRWVPFGEALIGWQGIYPKNYASQQTAAFFVGGGLDVKVSKHFLVRPFQADYVNSYYTKPFAAGTSNNLNGVRLQAGLIFAFGEWNETPAVLPVANCNIAPQAVDAGAQVHIGVSAEHFNPKRSLSYSYSSSVSKHLSAQGQGANIDTTGLTPGSYTVTALVADNGKGVKQQTASCQAAFRVNEPPRPNPPTLTVAARPALVTAGEPVAVTLTAGNPDQRPLTYRCGSSAGHLTPNGAAYTLDTTGAPSGTVNINCSVSDDRNLGATASTSVQVKVPPPPPTPQDFATVRFAHDTLRPARVDNEAKGALDRYADALAANADSTGVVVGYATAAENKKHKPGKKQPSLAEQRAVNTKDYVTREKGIDPRRIAVRTGDAENQSAELWVVPAGAKFNPAGTAAVNEAQVKAVPRKPLAHKAHAKAHKAAVKKPAPAAKAAPAAPAAPAAKSAPAAPAAPAKK